MGTAYTSDLLYHDFFLALAAEHENFYYHTAISRESGNANGAGFYIDGVIDRDFAHFAPTLATERTLMYVCGIEGMRYGVVRMLAGHELGASYFRVGDAITKSDPAQWTDTEIRRHVKAGARSFLEVY
jgi:Na+-transporting NADH:ubiquinone oxidoreductase subunit NqrF